MKKYGQLTKQKMLKALTDKISQNKHVFVSNFQKLSVVKIDELRKNLHAVSCDYVVVKNSISNIAFKNANMENLTKGISGMSGIVFTNSDPVVVSKVLMGFSKDVGTFKIFAASVEGAILGEDRVKQLSQLPSREALLTQLVCTMNAPVSGFVRVLNGLLRNFVYALDQIKQKKEKEGE